mgnify:CR=1 FL=1
MDFSVFLTADGWIAFLTLSLLEIVLGIDNIIFIGPNMLGSLGLPSIFVTGLKSVIGFVVAFDVAEAVTGRLFS